MSEARDTFIAKAVDLSETIRGAGRLHALEKAVGQFVGLLHRVPDYPASTFSPDAIGVLRTLAEGVIEKIEDRVHAGQDERNEQQVLVEAVYDIQAALEEIDRWRRHYLPA